MSNDMCEYFKDNIDYFDLKKEDFDYIKNLDPREYIFENNISRLVPILKEITFYALPSSFFSLTGLDPNYDEFEDSIYKDTEQLSDTCIDYLEDIVTNGCLHPTVLSYSNLIWATQSFTDLKKSIDNLSLLVDKPYLDIINEFKKNIYFNIDSYNSELVQELKVRLRSISDRKQFIKISSNMTNLIALNEGYLLGENLLSFKIRHNYFNINNKYPVIFKVSNNTDNQLTDTIKKLRTFKGEDIESVEIEKNKLLCIYQLFKTYQYNFIRLKEQEHFLVKKV